MRTFVIIMAMALMMAVALVSGNNLSACVGTAIGAGILSRRSGIALGVAGYTSGLLLQGSSMTYAAHRLLPSSSALLVTEALSATVAIFIIGNLIKAPLSLTMSLVGLITGISVAHHLPVDTAYFSEIAAMWAIAPLLALCSSYIFTRILSRSVPTDIWRRVSAFKVLLLAISFLAAYVLGANTVALMVSVAGFNTVDIVAAIIAIIAGSTMLSSRSLKRIGHDIFSLRYSNALVTLANSVMLVETATLFGIPLSNTQTLSAGVFGSGISYRQRYISVKPFAIIVAGWIAAPAVSFLIGYVL